MSELFTTTNNVILYASWGVSVVVVYFIGRYMGSKKATKRKLQLIKQCPECHLFVPLNSSNQVLEHCCQKKSDLAPKPNSVNVIRIP